MTEETLMPEPHICRPECTGADGILTCENATVLSQDTPHLVKQAVNEAQVTVTEMPRKPRKTRWRQHFLDPYNMMVIKGVAAWYERGHKRFKHDRSTKRRRDLLKTCFASLRALVK